MDRFLHRSASGAFGAFGIRARGTTCRRARRVAARYVLEPADPSAPVRIGRWRCTAHTVEAQVVRVRCALGAASLVFRDEIPNG